MVQGFIAGALLVVPLSDRLGFGKVRQIPNFTLPNFDDRASPQSLLIGIPEGFLARYYCKLTLSQAASSL